MKKLVKVVAPLVVLVLLGVGVKVGLDSRVVEGRKTVEIVFIAEEEEFFNEKITGDDFEVVGDVLTKIEGDGQLSFVFEGEEDSEWGRFITGVEDFVTEDMATGPWWLYDSPNNELVLEAGFPEGIDLQPVFDGDTFIFTFGG